MITMASSSSSVGLPSISIPPVQATHPCLDDVKKRPRPKNVTWASPEKLNQVHLFAAEDAPSGLISQDLLEAKKTKFMHALIPVSTNDLPPGFERAATKRARLDSAAVLAMNQQIAWHFPEKVLHDPLWQVALGSESSEVNAQRQREVKVLEAIYPRSSAIPPSSMEAPEVPLDFRDSQIPEIPLIPTEDEDDGMEEEDTSGRGSTGTSKPIASDFISGDSASTKYPPGYSPPKNAQNLTSKSQSKGGSSSAAAQFNSDLATAFLKNADPDVAAAAAAAYAVVKAKESGALIDHDLLIKILSNPLLIAALTASNPSLRNQLGPISSSTPLVRGNANGNGVRMKMEPSVEVSLPSALSSFIAQGRQTYDLADEIAQGWGSSNTSGLPTSQGRGYPLARAHEPSSAMKGMLGQARGVHMSSGPLGRMYPMPHPVVSRELSQQHAMAGMIANEAQLWQSGAPMAFDEGMLGPDSEWHRFGTVQPRLGINSTALPSAALSTRSNALPQDRFVGPKIRKQCFFYNTPKGCRNGVYCNFLHEAAPEKPPEKMHHDDSQEKQPKTTDAEA